MSSSIEDNELSHNNEWADFEEADFEETNFEELISSSVIWDSTPPCSRAPSEHPSPPKTPCSTPDRVLSPLSTPLYNLDLSNVAPLSSLPANPSHQSPSLDSATKEASRKDDRLVQIFAGLIAQLQAEDCSFAAWLSFLFHHERRGFAKSLRRTSFWEHPDDVQKLLDSWTHSRQTASGRVLVKNWAKQLIAKELQAESKRITSKKVLQSSSREIGPEYLETFRIQTIREDIQEHCSVSIQMLLAIAGVDLSQTTLESAPVSARNVTMYCMASMLREVSRLNNLLQVVFSLYIYTLLVSGMGVSSRRKSKKQSNDTGEATSIKPKDPTIGPLKALSNGCLKRLRRLASPASGKYLGFIFDNINLVRKVAEQVLGRIDTQLNGTCAMVYELWGATKEALNESAAMDSFLSARPLKPQDIVLSPSERSFYRQLMIHHILRSIVEHGGEHFTRYQSLLEATQPSTEHKIDLHQTRVYSTPAMQIDESSADGVIDVMTEIFRILEVDRTTSEFQNTMHLVGGDGKSVGHLRTAKESRAGNDDKAYSFSNLIPLIGLFHALMAAITGFLVIHFGDPLANKSNPSSLSYHNAVLERKPFTLSSLPPVSVSRGLINVSLIARILHCLTLVTGSTLDDYAKFLATLDPKPQESVEKSWAQLKLDATQIWDKYANAQTVQDLRSNRRVADPGEKEGDMVYENALLYIRDALTLRELITATKRGDPGCLVLVFKVLALSFRASGRTQYAFEALSLIHHIQVVWPAPLRDLVLKNWLLNPTGKPDAWVPQDLVQEHSNFWIKRVFTATGSSLSWSWLAVISPCTEALRNLVNDLNGTLGTYLGVEHTSPDLSLDIAKLMRSLEELKVYQIVPGRTFDDADKPAIDAETVGLQKLVDGSKSGLSEYNSYFESTQKAFRQPVVSEMVPYPRPDNNEPQAGFQPTTEIEAQADIDTVEDLDDESKSDDGLEEKGSNSSPESAASDCGSDSGERRTTEEFQPSDIEDYWVAQDDEETWLDDMGIFMD
ncbi:Protein furry homolog [Homo sapiens] [Rhizoctonia solani]|uniref:Protein furry homolog [Homo sapiens] n=1 Tax=Rhizoctonia solani TaxID=456999 RepID=A0A0K6FXY1_9AGAM|nr:Protein furry homolog [Homo sapiens] [Rhizoctonia solani]